ncbi:copper transport protein Ctr1p [Monosporozyma servazzii]
MDMNMSSITHNMATKTISHDSSMSMMATNTATMSMAMSSGSSMDGMDGMSMGMNSYLTRKYFKYPVVFEKLYATNNSEAFGIFVLILVAAFAYKFLLFVNWTLEIHWFKKWNKTRKRQNVISLKENTTNANVFIRSSADYDSDATEVYQDQNGLQLATPLPQLPNLMFDIFAPNIIDLMHDFIRICIIFTSTMIIYVLMLAAMSFILTYVFAVITGLSLSEVFYNRCKMALLRRWEVQRELEKINNCIGGINCKCGRHRRVPANSNEKNNNANDDDDKCCCDNEGVNERANQDRNVERTISEATKLQEQGGDMDANLMPPQAYLN